LPSIDEQNFKDYLETVLKEVKKTRWTYLFLYIKKGLSNRINQVGNTV
jgi:hypothetical protein